MSSGALIVMYHYVRPDESTIPGGIRPLLVSEFEKQLDWLGDRYEIMGAEEFLDRGLGKRRGKPACLLTFDDGTKDHAEVVTPILKSRGLTGVFFVLSGPAEEAIMPVSHALHWLLGKDDEKLWKLFQEYGTEQLGDLAQAERIYHYESPLRAKIKYAANMALPAEITERIVEVAVKTAGRSMRDLAGEWFVSASDIQKMHDAGMTIGVHGHSHRSVGSLGPQAMRQEIHHCAGYLSSLIGESPTWYACPFGGADASAQVQSAMKTAMTDAGIIAAVSTVKSFVQSDADRFALPRFDTIDLPPRRRLSS